MDLKARSCFRCLVSVHALRLRLLVRSFFFFFFHVNVLRCLANLADRDLDFVVVVVVVVVFVNALWGDSWCSCIRAAALSLLFVTCFVSCTCSV